MPWVEIKNERDELVWKSPEVGTLIVERVEGTVRVIDMDDGQVVATYHLKPGEYAVNTGEN